MRLSLFCLVVAGLTLSSCSGQKQPDAGTEFFREFSFDKLVGQAHPSGLKAPSGGGGSSSSAIRRRKDFRFIYMIEETEGAKFDEVGFITKLKAEVEKAADDAGVHRYGWGGGDDAFNFSYYDDEQEGWVEVVGTRMEGSRYKLWGVIVENSKNAKQ